MHFDLDLIRRAPFVGHLEWHNVVSSTNDRGMRLAGGDAIATPYLILAGEQTAGRGRGLNRWWSDAGALTFSLVIDPQRDLRARGSPPLTIERWPRIALSAGVALCDVIGASLPGLSCRLKWPNDVILDGRKVAGILVEVPPAPAPDVRRVVLGMGVNVNNSLQAAPAEVQATGISLCDAARTPFDATQLLLEWLDRFAAHLHALAGDDAALPARWQTLCALKDKTVELQSGNRSVKGLCRGIDTDGALLVDTAGGRERIYAGVLVRTTAESH